MFYNVLTAKDTVSFENGMFERKVLMEKDDSSLSVIALKKDEIIDTHTSVCDAAVYVLEGEVLMFKKDDQHKVLANKDSKFLLIKI